MTAGQFLGLLTRILVWARFFINFHYLILQSDSLKLISIQLLSYLGVLKIIFQK